MPEQITVGLDRASRAALQVLTADETSITDAVRAAITEAAERYPEPPAYDDQQLTEHATNAEWVAAQVAAAPPWTDYQVHVLRAAFFDKQSTWLSEEQWRRAHDAARDT